MNLSPTLLRYYGFFACADAVGKATEFMTYEEIKSKIGHIDGLVPSEKSQNHPDLDYRSVTDDTEQNVWLLKQYGRDGKVTIENTVTALLRWVEMTDAVTKKYIGPSSYKALTDIKNGKDPHETGLFGTTCGGIMRVPAAVFASYQLGQDLDECVYNALVCTHNNSVALESAYAYAYALDYAMRNPNTVKVKDLFREAKKGCQVGIKKSPWESASATLYARLCFIEKYDIQGMTKNDLKKFLYGVLGTGLPSYEVSGAVFALLKYTTNPVQVMSLAAETGGDTDTIGALACGLASMVDLKTPLPSHIEGPVREYNDYVWDKGKNI